MNQHFERVTGGWDQGSRSASIGQRLEALVAGIDELMPLC